MAVKLTLGETEYPVAFTVGALDALAQMGVTPENLFQYYGFEGQPFDTAVEHAVAVLGVLLEAGAEVARIQTGTDGPHADLGVVRRVLTPGQLAGLIDAAIADGLTRTVEADHSKNANDAV